MYYPPTCSIFQMDVSPSSRSLPTTLHLEHDQQSQLALNKRNSPLTKLECISNVQRMFTLKNPNLIPWAKDYSNANPSGLRSLRIWIGMGPWLLGYQFGFSKVNILRSLDSSILKLICLHDHCVNNLHTHVVRCTRSKNGSNQTKNVDKQDTQELNQVRKMTKNILGYP